MITVSPSPRSLWLRRLAGAVALVAVVTTVVACSDDDVDEATPEGPLTGVCPDPVVVQTDWYPEAEHGAVYHLLDPDRYDVDTDAKTVRAPLVADGEVMGVDLEVRVGGPAIGFQQVAAQMYLDTEILFGFVNTDEAIQTHARFPTVAVVAPLDINPQMIMWDPDTYDVDTIADLPSDTVVNVFGPDAYLDHMVGTGILQPGQIDGGYTGAPARFVAADGTIAQQGFATAEPYSYEHLIEEWERPVRFQLIHDTGWEVYAQAMAVRPDALDDHASCLEAVVPMVQWAIVDYISDPGATNDLIVDLVDRYDDGWVYERELARWSVDQQVALGVVGNGPDSTVGNFDLDRIERVLANAVPVMGIGEDLEPGDLATNRFIDPEIGFPNN